MTKPMAPIDDNMASGLSHMAEMPNYMNWIIHHFSPYLKGEVVEVGAGIGSYIPYYQPYATHVAAVEPNPVFSRYLKEHYQGVEVIESTIEKIPPEFHKKFDSVVCINALEHFEDDQFAVTAMASLLGEGGNLCIYVPARQELFGKWDESVGHFRRYEFDMLRHVVESAGLTIEELKYTDVLGGVAWYFSAKFGASPERHDTALGKSMKIFDAGIVPVQRAIEKFISPPWGKSLVCVAVRA